jgi:hypothetical protein
MDSAPFQNVLRAADKKALRAHHSISAPAMANRVCIQRGAASLLDTLAASERVTVATLTDEDEEPDDEAFEDEDA